MSRFKGIEPRARHEEHMQHLDEGTIHAWLDGALPADEATAVERHAHECAQCGALVAHARGMIAGAARIVSALDDVPSGVIPKQAATARRSVWRTMHLTPFRAALAASLLVAAGSLAVIRHAPQPGVNVALNAPASPTLATAPASAPPPNKPAPAAASGRPLSNAVSQKRLRVQDEAPPSAPAAAAPAPREAARRAPITEVAKAASTADSTSTTRAAALGGAAPAALAPTSLEARAKMADTLRKREEPAVSATRQAPAANAISGARSRDASMRDAVATEAQAFSLVLTSADNRPLTIPGCYQLTRDSVDVQRPSLPERFSLDNERAPAMRGSVMRALTQDGRRDSVLTGITWEPAPGAPNTVIVRRENPLRSSLRQQTMSSPAAASLNGYKLLRLSRIDCR
jgi:putative zinc finger protein